MLCALLTAACSHRKSDEALRYCEGILEKRLPDKGPPVFSEIATGVALSPDEFLARCGAALWRIGPEDVLVLYRADPTHNGYAANRFRQLHKGYVVSGIGPILTTLAGHVTSVSGAFAGDLDIDAAPTVSLDEAKRTALLRFAADIGLSERPESYWVSEGELLVLPGRNALAYRFRLATPHPVAERVIDVHAVTREVIGESDIHDDGCFGP